MSSFERTSLQDFDKIKILGKGSFSSVYLVKRKQDSKIYALKTVFLEKLPKKQQENSINEVRILASIHHQNVISYKEAFWDDNTSSLNIVMEYADDGDLSTKIKNLKEKKLFFEEQKIWDLSIQIIQGLKALHDKNIMHRDLKSENIFLMKKNFQCKIGDMNVSKVLKEKLLKTQIGTPYYASPEVWMNKPYSFKSDLWSAGCVIYEMCELRTPFKGKDMDELFVNICLNKLERINKKYSDELWFIIKKLLEVNVEKRFDCSQFLQSDIVKKKMNELKNIEEYQDLTDNSLLLNTIIFNDIKDIKKQLPNKKYYNEESTTESNCKKEKENNYEKDNNKILIRELRKELENMKYNQELIKKSKNVSTEKNQPNENLENNLIKQKIKHWDNKFKNIKIKNNLKLYNNKNKIPINYNYKNIRYIKRCQLNELSKFNNSLENIKSSYNIQSYKNKNNISYRNINIDNNLYKKYKHESFNLNTLIEKNKNIHSFSYNIDDNQSKSKIPLVIINTNNINNNHDINNFKNKLLNKLRYINSTSSISNKEDNNNYIYKNKKIGDNYQININFNFIPNNYQKYFRNNIDRYNLENLHNKTVIKSSRINNSNKLNEYMNNSKQNIEIKKKQNRLIKGNSFKKLLEINIDSNLKRIKNLLSRNKILKFDSKSGKITSFKNKSFSEKIKKNNMIKIFKKKIINKKNLLINQIPKCNISNSNRNVPKIPCDFKQLKTYGNNEGINSYKNL